MRQIRILIMFIGLISFLGFSNKSNDTTSIKETSLKISQTQLDELNQISSHGIDLIKDNYINHGSFLPVIFSYSKNKNFKVIAYDEPSIKEKSLPEYAYRILIKISDSELKIDSIRIICIAYNGIIKNDKYPNGSDCIYFLFNSKEFDNSVLISFPVKTENVQLILGDKEVQIIKK
jgi:hypothetical protein